MTDLVFFYGTLMSVFQRSGRSRIESKLSPQGRAWIGATRLEVPDEIGELFQRQPEREAFRHQRKVARRAGGHSIFRDRLQPSFVVEQRERLRGLAFNQAGESFALAGFDHELPVTLADDLAWIEHVLDQVPARKLSPDQCQVGTDRAAATGDRVTLGAGDTAAVIVGVPN